MDVWVQVPSLAPASLPRQKRRIYARVVELADSLDSGSSVHYARAGSSPASRTTSFLQLHKHARVVELADSLDSGSSVHYARAGSSPASRTIRKALETARFQGLFPLETVLALLLALFLRKSFDEPLHTVSAIAFHLFCYMTIDIQRKSCGMMAKIFLQIVKITYGSYCGSCVSKRAMKL